MIVTATASLVGLALAGCASTGPSGGATAPASDSAGSSAPISDDAVFDGDITNNSLAVSPDESTAVVSDSREKSVLVYDLSNGKLRKKLTGFGSPRNIVFIDDGSQFVVSDSTLGTLRFYGTEDLSLKDEVVVGPGAFGTAASPDGTTLYVNNAAHSSVTLVDLALRKPTDVVTGFAQPRQGIKVSPEGTKVFVTNFEGDKVTVIDADSKAIVGELAGFSNIRGISISPDGNTLYAANSGRNSISVVDVNGGAITSEIAVGVEPYGAALSPDGTLLFASNKVDNTIDVIDTSTNTIVKTLTGFEEPRQAIVFNASSKRAYVLNRDLSIALVDVKSLEVTDTIRK